ncbi:MAG: GNAT family N-acetyltransferase [Aquidulcibacter sp.]
MLIRLALEEDFPAIVEMARANIEETRPEIGFDEHLAYETCYAYLDTASPTIFVAERNREVVGFLLADMYSYRASPGIHTMQEVLFVAPAHRGTRAAVMLMKHFIAWSIGLGAKEIIGGNDNSFQSDRTARFLEHFGFERVGHAMRRKL